MGPPPINRLPVGLLDFLGIRAGGRNPQNLTEQLLPTLDLLRWYKDAQQFLSFVSLAPLVANQNEGILPLTGLPGLTNGLVPNNEAWILMPGTGLGWSFDVVAGLRARGQMCIQQNPGAGSGVLIPLPMLPWGYDTSDAAIIQGGGMTLMTEMWMPPNSRLVVYTAGALAGAADPVTYNANVALVKVRI